LDTFPNPVADRSARDVVEVDVVEVVDAPVPACQEAREKKQEVTPVLKGREVARVIDLILSLIP
jgi:hypothetical protein